MNRSVRVFIGLESIPVIGGWIDVDPDPDTTNEAIEAVRAAIIRDHGHDIEIGPDPETGVMDTDDYPGRSSDLTTIQAVVTAADHVGADIDAVVAYVENGGASWDDGYDLASSFKDAFAGHADTEADFAQNFAEETSSEALDAAGDFARYIDWEAFARDLFMDMWSAPCPTGGIYAFHSN